MQARYSLGFSPCPNDTFIFYALVHSKVAPEITWRVDLEDVEALNQWARAGTLDVTKISYHAYAHLMEEYVMLRSGGALGQGCGPLIVTKDRLETLSGKRVAIPGGLTTANLLLKLSQPDDIVPITLRYDRIMPAVAAGEVDAGLIIHESRFTFAEYGLQQFLDLGQWWEETTGLLIPLGGIMAKRSLGLRALKQLEQTVRDSIAYSYAHRAEIQPYIAAHAQEMSPEVMQQHIDLYVNAYSSDVGALGEASVQELFKRGRARGIVPQSTQSLFIGG